MNKKIIITTSWDDGHKLDLKVARLLKKYKLKGTFYISPKNREFENKELLSDYDVKKISKDFEIGAHTMTHPNLQKISDLEVFEEINESKKYLKKLIKKNIFSFCYPYGSYNSSVKKLVKKAGFKMARTTVRFNKSENKDKLSISTSVHAYTHKKDLLNLNLISKYKSISWEKIAKQDFDKCLEKGGVFHLWGHSWEIEKFHDWNRLENVFKYISNKKNAKYIENRNL